MKEKICTKIREKLFQVLKLLSQYEELSKESIKEMSENIPGNLDYILKNLRRMKCIQSKEKNRPMGGLYMAYAITSFGRKVLKDPSRRIISDEIAEIHEGDRTVRQQEKCVKQQQEIANEIEIPVLIANRNTFFKFAFDLLEEKHKASIDANYAAKLEKIFSCAETSSWREKSGQLIREEIMQRFDEEDRSRDYENYFHKKS